MLDEAAFQGVPLAVVGSICRDVKTAPLTPGSHLFRDGETPTECITETLGGGGANSAAMAAGLGARVTFAGKVGADSLAERLTGVLARLGIRVLARRDPAIPTGSSIALSFTDGQRHFISHQPNNTTLALADLDLAALFADGGHLLRADVWFSTPMLFDGNVQLLSAARAAGLGTSLDINWDPQWNVAAEEAITARIGDVRALLPLVDLIHGNVNELNRFTGADDLDISLRRLIDWGAGAVVVHLGKRGSGYYSGGKLICAPCAPVTRYVNSAGTGDLLSTCMMLLHHRTDVSPLDKLQLANRVVAEFIEGRRALLPAV